MNSRNRVLIIFIKNVEAGKVKTRLAATVGVEKAMIVYDLLIKHTNQVVQNIAADKFIFYDSYIDMNDRWDNSIFYKKMQNGNDLGRRMLNAFKDLFDDGYHNIIIIGSDCAELNTDLMEKAFDKLFNSDVVIGPAKDGGYYLLGMKKFYSELFENIEWSTDKVLSQTLLTCKKLNLSTFLLPELSDIDDEKDLNNSINLLSAIKEE
jgi:uncharacterized protein